MTETNEGTLETNFVLNIILRHEWVDEEILLTYEQCYRICKKMMILNNEDTTELDKVRNQIMELYGQI